MQDFGIASKTRWKQNSRCPRFPRREDGSGTKKAPDGITRPRQFLLYRDQIYAPSSATCVVYSSYLITETISRMRFRTARRIRKRQRVKRTRPHARYSIWYRMQAHREDSVIPRQKTAARFPRPPLSSARPRKASGTFALASAFEPLAPIPRKGEPLRTKGTARYLSLQSRPS